MTGEPPTQLQDPTTATRPSDEEMRAAYEAELNRITSTEMILQTAVSLLNIGGRRLGLVATSDPSAPNPDATAPGGRDLEQVRDAIDGVRALMPVLERRMPGELAPLRDAVSQLQMAYAREVQAARDPSAAVPEAAPAPAGAPVPADGPAPAPAAAPAPAGASVPADGPAPAPAAAAPQGSTGEPVPHAGGVAGADEGKQKPAPGPAESSGRLWVPGR